MCAWQLSATCTDIVWKGKYWDFLNATSRVNWKNEATALYKITHKNTRQLRTKAKAVGYVARTHTEIKIQLNRRYYGIFDTGDCSWSGLLRNASVGRGQCVCELVSKWCLTWKSGWSVDMWLWSGQSGSLTNGSQTASWESKYRQ